MNYLRVEEGIHYSGWIWFTKWSQNFSTMGQIRRNSPSEGLGFVYFEFANSDGERRRGVLPSRSAGRERTPDEEREGAMAVFVRILRTTWRGAQFSAFLSEIWKR